MIRLLLLLGLSVMPKTDVVTSDFAMPVAASAEAVDNSVAVAPCNEDCHWSTTLRKWVCTLGSVGRDCEETDGGGCSFINCFGYAQLNAGGALNGLALCEGEMMSVVAYAEASGDSFLIDKARRSGLLLTSHPLPISSE